MTRHKLSYFQKMDEDFELKLPKPYKPSQSHKTLQDLAAEAKQKIEQREKVAEISLGRLTEAVLWTSTFTMLHFTLDLLVTHQYATEVDWTQILWRAIKAFPVILLLTYAFHPHPSPPSLLPLFPTFPRRFQFALHQTSFFITAITAGSYLVHTTNIHPYYAIMKQVPPLGYLWVWSMIELEILPAMVSVAFCGLFLKLGGYSLI
ncbi:putative deacetylase-like protein [Erysiphe neolycopersici]|uniref:Putative deacetylase-like protein n=1 Tax=Erysiphe neolycopersici TaxID=212602 RepID=A0A420I4Y9_9PEZI|nr:putative deacetylase-like protein [Erysiphe neolycopersici]